MARFMVPLARKLNAPFAAVKRQAGAPILGRQRPAGSQQPFRIG